MQPRTTMMHLPHMKTCTHCRIVLDQPCPNPVCPGHDNDSIGDLCRYCATHQRDAFLQTDVMLDLFSSSISDLDDSVLDDASCLNRAVLTIVALPGNHTSHTPGRTYLSTNL